jgi:hypothetical protein
VRDEQKEQAKKEKQESLNLLKQVSAPVAGAATTSTEAAPAK